MSIVQLSKLLSACIHLVKQAGKEIQLIHQGKNLDITYKSKDDPVTVADFISQKIIVGGLKAVWPDLTIIGEESIETPISNEIPELNIIGDDFIPHNLKEILSSEITIYVDPLDATREFTQDKLQCVTCLVGISKNGEPIAGIIHLPFHGDQGRTVYGVVGGSVIGLQKNTKHEGIVLITTASHNSPQVEKAIQLIQPDKVIREGGAGYKSLLLMEKLVDVYVYPTMGCKLWDTCAPHALLNALGGTMTTPKGAKIQYSPPIDVNLTEGLIASLSNHDQYIKKLANL